MDEIGGTAHGRTVPPFDLDTEFGRDLAAVDWAATDVGPWQHWPASLANTVRLITGSRFAMWMAWGPSLTFFCNDAYRRDTLGGEVPVGAGPPGQGGLVGDLGRHRRPHRRRWSPRASSTWDERMLLFLERSGYTEETYHTFSYSPIHGDDGTIAGMLCVVSEDTARVIGERRMALLRDLSSALAAASTLDDVAAAARRELATDAHDLPFALGYLVDEDGTAQLRWATGMRPAEPAAPPVLHPDDTSVLWHDAVFGSRDSAASGHASPDTVHVDLREVSGLPRGPWPSPPVEALAVPLPGRRSGARAAHRRGQPASARSTTTTAPSSSSSPRSCRRRCRGPRPSSRNASGSSSWPPSTTRRRPSSPTSATSCAPR